MQRPLPRVTPDSKPFWDACKRRQWLLPFCLECGSAHLPPGPVCPYCFSDRLEWKQASGRGSVSTWVVVHKAWFPAFEKDIPYNVVQVELAEGPRVTSRIVGIDNSQLKLGLSVVVDFEDVNEEIALPVFRPA